MNDIELLELAAKAAGIDGDYSPRADAIVHCDGYFMPHKNYSDALVLAETLGLLVGKCSIKSGVYFSTRRDLPSICEAATMPKAITMAAAAIGKTMP